MAAILQMTFASAIIVGLGFKLHRHSPIGPMNNRPALLTIMAWRLLGGNSLSESMVHWCIYGSPVFDELITLSTMTNVIGSFRLYLNGQVFIVFWTNGGLAYWRKYASPILDKLIALGAMGTSWDYAHYISAGWYSQFPCDYALLVSQ